MSKRFKSTLDEDTMSIMPYLVSDNEEECFYNLEDCVDLLNEQQSIIDEQKIAIDEMITDYKNLEKENEQLKGLIKKTLETTPIEHNLAVALKNSVREFYE